MLGPIVAESADTKVEPSMPDAVVAESADI
jgi:hypothetical protein